MTLPGRSLKLAALVPFASIRCRYGPRDLLTVATRLSLSDRAPSLASKALGRAFDLSMREDVHFVPAGQIQRRAPARIEGA